MEWINKLALVTDQQTPRSAEPQCDHYIYITQDYLRETETFVRRVSAQIMN